MKPSELAAIISYPMQQLCEKGLVVSALNEKGDPMEEAWLLEGTEGPASPGAHMARLLGAEPDKARVYGEELLWTHEAGLSVVCRLLDCSPSQATSLLGFCGCGTLYPWEVYPWGSPLPLVLHRLSMIEEVMPCSQGSSANHDWILRWRFVLLENETV